MLIVISVCRHLTGEISIEWQILADDIVENEKSKSTEVKKEGEKEVEKKSSPMTPEDRKIRQEQLLKLVSWK